MKREVKKQSFFGNCKACAKKELAKWDDYAEFVIIAAVMGFLFSLFLKLAFPNLAPTQINSLTAYRFSSFLILLGLVLFLHKRLSDKNL